MQVHMATHKMKQIVGFISWNSIKSQSMCMYSVIKKINKIVLNLIIPWDEKNLQYLIKKDVYFSRECLSTDFYIQAYCYSQQIAQHTFCDDKYFLFTFDLYAVNAECKMSKLYAISTILFLIKMDQGWRHLESWISNVYNKIVYLFVLHLIIFV